LSNATVTLDQLIALSDEIAALARAGMPLELGLEALGRDMPGGLGRLAETLAERSSRGQPLAAALAELGPHMPPACRAVVEAGLRAGRLEAALESLAGMLRRLAELRRMLAVALLYPLIVLALAWGLFAFFTAALAPELLAMLKGVGARGTGPLELLVRCGQGAWIWGPLGPAGLLLLAVLWWQVTRRASLAGGPAAAWLFGWLPWFGRSLRWSRAAAFTDILAVLVENRVPLDQALQLAGQSCGDPRMSAGAAAMAAGVRSGGPPGLPPLLIWLIAGSRPPSPSGRGAGGEGERLAAMPPRPQAPTAGSSLAEGEGALSAAVPPHPNPLPEGEGTKEVLPSPSGRGAGGEGALLPALRHAAAHYHRRARQQAELAQVLLPALTSLAIGVVVACFGLAVFLPYVTILHRLGG